VTAVVRDAPKAGRPACLFFASTPHVAASLFASRPGVPADDAILARLKGCRKATASGSKASGGAESNSKAAHP